ncbi:hypothetical protein GCM10027517_03170 [Phycicoccus ginsengisoli]
MSTSQVNLAALAHARAVRLGTPEAIDATRAALATAKIEAAIERALADDPPLTGDQRARLVRLIMRDAR